MNPNAELTKDDADLYIGRVCGRELKFTISPDGQVTRKSYVRNMNLYPYILESIPDNFYTRALKCMLFQDTETGKMLYNSGVDRGNGKIWSDGGGQYTTPSKMIELHGPNGTSPYQYRIFEDVEYQSELEAFVEEYLMKTFNVDYRTTPTDTAWRSFMLGILDGLIMSSDADNVEKALVDNYLDLMKKNHTKIECDKVYAEASTIYYTKGVHYIRCYVHYRVVSCDSTELVWIDTEHLKGDMSPLLFNLSTMNGSEVDLHDLKVGEWRTGYFDIGISRDELIGIYPLRVWQIEFSDRYNDYSIADY